MEVERFRGYLIGFCCLTRRLRLRNGRFPSPQRTCVCLCARTNRAVGSGRQRVFIDHHLSG